MIICRILVGKVAAKYKVNNYDVANIIGITKDQLSRIITNKVNIPYYFIPVLCFYLGYTFDDFQKNLINREIDGYIDSHHNLIINGVKIDKVDDNLLNF
jgi:DNA-binding Xre family transcriptional regulator